MRRVGLRLCRERRTLPRGAPCSLVGRGAGRVQSRLTYFVVNMNNASRMSGVSGVIDNFKKASCVILTTHECQRPTIVFPCTRSVLRRTHRVQASPNLLYDRRTKSVNTSEFFFNFLKIHLRKNHDVEPHRHTGQLFAFDCHSNIETKWQVDTES